MGCLGMSRDDFESSTPSEFEQIYCRWKDNEDRKSRDGWYQTRLLATLMLQPFSKNTLKPEDVISFSWEDGKRPDETRSTRERMKEIEARIKRVSVSSNFEDDSCL